MEEQEIGLGLAGKMGSGGRLFPELRKKIAAVI